MELQLDLSLSTTHNPIDGSNLNNKGFDPHDQILGLKPWNHDGCLLDKKRSFEDAFGKFKDSPQALSLLLWSGHPNDEDDEKREKKRLSCRLSKMNEEVMEGDDLVVGWPPIESWRKKVLRQQPSGGRIVNNRVAGGGGSDLINSKYVKVKMEGVAIARKIDLKLFHSYQTLTRSLITMFGKCQQLEKDNANYRLAYQDKDGDWLLAGDIPWQSFIESVHRLELLRNGG